MLVRTGGEKVAGVFQNRNKEQNISDFMEVIEARRKVSGCGIGAGLTRACVEGTHRLHDIILGSSFIAIKIKVVLTMYALGGDALQFYLPAKRFEEGTPQLAFERLADGPASAL